MLRSDIWSWLNERDLCLDKAIDQKYIREVPDIRYKIENCRYDKAKCVAKDGVWSCRWSQNH